jgi:hypothetical protein
MLQPEERQQTIHTLEAGVDEQIEAMAQVICRIAMPSKKSGC